ncbi:hypothetical protein Tco_0825201, partial [Tanacetum coccineum]
QRHVVSLVVLASLASYHMKSSISLGEVAPQQLLKFRVMSYDSHTNNVMAVGFQCDGKWMVPGCQQEYESRAAVNTIVLHPNEVVALKYSAGMGRVKVADVCCRRNVATWFIETLNQHPWSVVISVSAGCIVTVMKLGLIGCAMKPLKSKLNALDMYLLKVEKLICLRASKSQV